MSFSRTFGLTAVAPLLALCACFPGSKSLGEGETDDGTSTSTSGGSASDSGQSTTGPGTSAANTTGQASGTASDSDSESSGASETATSTGGSATTSGTGAATDSGGDEVCELEPIVIQITSETKAPLDQVVDCGYLTLEDTVEEWQAGHDCAVQADSMSSTYRLIWDIQGIDSYPSRAIVGLQGDGFARAEYFEDKGGLGGGRTVSQRECGEFVITPNCTPDVGRICLTCDNMNDTALVCSAPQ